MSLADEVKKNVYFNYERYGEAADFGVTQQQWRDYDSTLESVLNSEIGSITSRDQIYDPYDLVRLHMYGNGANAQAAYNADLARAKQFVERQEAAYQEWYNSPEQMAIRQREAGLNPDLSGIDGTSEAADVSSPEGSPLDNIPSTEQQFASVIGGIGSIVGSLSSVASLATAFTNIGLSPYQKNSLISQDYSSELSNIDSLKTLISSDISDALATAVDLHNSTDSLEPFDYDSWFNDDNNFNSLKSSYGHFPFFDSALSNARRQSLRFHKNASELQKDTLSFDFDIGKLLSDPRLSPSQKLTAIQVRPYVTACYEADKLDAEVRSAIANFNKDYYSNSDGSLVSSFDKLFRDTQSIAFRLESKINEGYISMFDSEPNGFNGFRAAYLYGSKGGRSWQDAFMLHSKENVDILISSLVSEAEATRDTAKLRAFISALGNLTSKDTNIADWQKNKVGWSLYRAEMIEYIESLQKICESIDLQ